MFGILEAVAMPRTGVYETLEELINELYANAQKEGYKVVKARSHRSKPGAPIMRVDLCCERGGRPYKCAATKHKTSTKKTDCPWKAKAVDRKSIGGWLLTIMCDQHNHEPGTPEPPTPTEGSEVAEDEEEDETPEGPRPDPETSAALQVAGVSDTVLRLSGDTFHRFKNDYRKMSHPERMGMLAQMQLRIAAIYAVQNEDLQRQRRQEAQDKRHQGIELSKRNSEPYVSRHRGGAPRVPHPGNPILFPETVAGGADTYNHQPGNAPDQYARVAPAAPLPPQLRFEPLPTPTGVASARETPVPSGNQSPGQFLAGTRRLRGHRPSQGQAPSQQTQPTQQTRQQGSASNGSPAPHQMTQQDLRHSSSASMESNP